MNSEYIIEARELSFSYNNGETPLSNKDDIPAVKSVDLSIKKGEYIAVLGHNGSGKSTLAKMLNLILIPTSGKLFIDGKDVSSAELSDDEVFDIRKRIGMVFQNPDNQIVATVVEEDVAFGVENLGLPREEIRRRVTSSLNMVGMQDYARHAPHKLSGGQKQRVAIAGIIAMRPEIIIFDEATAMLDPLGRKSVVEIMEKLNREENITIINITHHMSEAARADRVIIMNDGQLITDGAPQDVFKRVEFLHSIGLEAPQAIELEYYLKKNGFDIDLSLSDTETAVNKIYSAICEKKQERN